MDGYDEGKTYECRGIDNLQSFMVELARKIGGDDLKKMVGLCAEEHLQKRDRERILKKDDSYLLLEKLKEAGKLSKDDPNLLIKLLEESGCGKLAEQVKDRFQLSECDDPKLDSFQQFLVKLARDIGTGELKKMVGLCAEEHLQKRDRERILAEDDSYLLLEKLKEAGKLSKDDPSLLINLLEESGCVELAEQVKARFHLSGCDDPKYKLDSFHHFMVKLAGEIGAGDLPNIVRQCDTLQKSEREKILDEGDPYKLLEKLKESGKLSNPTLLIKILKDSGYGELATEVKERYKKGFE